MDYNSVKSRLERVYSSINKQFENDISKHVDIVETDEIISISFNNDNDTAGTLNSINTIIHNLANLKDNLKNILDEKGLKGQFIEDEINNSIYLQLVVDLSNQEKHGYPLKRIRRSKKDPLIKNINRHLSMSGNDSSVIIDQRTNQIKSTGDSKIVITANITDSKGRILFKLDELVDNSINKWEEIIKKYNIC